MFIVLLNYFVPTLIQVLFLLCFVCCFFCLTSEIGWKSLIWKKERVKSTSKGTRKEFKGFLMPITLYNCKFFSFARCCFEVLTKASRGNHFYLGYVWFHEKHEGNYVEKKLERRSKRKCL